jgi:hypothetical protein
MLLIIIASVGGQFSNLGSANAEQIIVRDVDYSNDSISDQGKTAACIVTLVVASPPDQRILNFQFLAFKATAGWKITGGRTDWDTQAMTALRARDGSFSSSSFAVPEVFRKSLTPEGQLVGILTQPEQLSAFTTAFFTRPYTAVTWEGLSEELTYYVAFPPPEDVKAKFLMCVQTL